MFAPRGEVVSSSRSTAVQQAVPGGSVESGSTAAGVEMPVVICTGLAENAYRVMRAKIFPNISDVRLAGEGGGGLDQKCLKDIPQFCIFSSVVHAEFFWTCGLFPQ